MQRTLLCASLLGALSCQSSLSTPTTNSSNLIPAIAVSDPCSTHSTAASCQGDASPRARGSMSGAPLARLAPRVRVSPQIRARVSPLRPAAPPTSDAPGPRLPSRRRAPRRCALWAKTVAAVDTASLAVPRTTPVSVSSLLSAPRTARVLRSSVIALRPHRRLTRVAGLVAAGRAPVAAPSVHREPRAPHVSAIAAAEPEARAAVAPAERAEAEAEMAAAPEPARATVRRARRGSRVRHAAAAAAPERRPLQPFRREPQLRRRGPVSPPAPTPGQEWFAHARPAQRAPPAPHAVVARLRRRLPILVPFTQTPPAAWLTRPTLADGRRSASHATPRLAHRAPAFR